MNGASSTTHDTDRPIRLRARPDLVFNRHQSGGNGKWTVKDPVSLSYFHLGDEEKFLLQELDGETSLARLKSSFEARFAPQTVSLSYLLDFCGRLHTNGLVLAEANGQGDTLLDRRQKDRMRRAWQLPFSALAIRFPAFNAGSVLNALEPVGRVLFHPLFAVLAVIAAFLALALMVGESQQILARLPDAKELFTGMNTIVLLLCLGIVKVLHEFGHGLACRRFGGECNSIGVMLLVFTPCLYCDVSDAWMIRSRMQRILVSAAGMYIELLLATTCAFIWILSISPPLSAFCLNIIIVCTVSTLLVNGNPLLRYDGYYILSDAIGAPNLYSESRRALWRPLKEWLARPAIDTAEEEPTRYELVTYAILSTVYRVFILGVILWAIYRVLDSLNLRPIGDFLVAMVLVGMCIPCVLFCGQFVRNPFQRLAFRWNRLGILAFGIVLLLAAFVAVPFPRHLEAPLLVQAANAKSVYAEVDGQLVASCEEGTRLKAGTVLATLENPDLERQLVRLEGEARELDQHATNLRLQATQSQLLLAEIPTADAALQDVKRRIASLRQDIARLTITSPQTGTVIPAVFRTQSYGDRGRELVAWSGTPLMRANAMCYLEQGDEICRVGDPAQMESLLMVNQADVDSVYIGARVKMRLDQSPGRTWTGQVVEIARGAVDKVPRTLASAAAVPVEKHGPREGSPLETSYFARVKFDDQPAHVGHGSCGVAKIVTDYEPLAGRLARFIGRAFRFQL